MYEVHGIRTFHVDSDSIDRVHTVHVNQELTHGTCDGPHCWRGNCKHIQKVLKAAREDNDVQE
jgi:hypothetical protein